MPPKTHEDAEMFCNQCEQTSKGEGCFTTGVCGKDPGTSALQDLLTYTLRGLGQAARAARAEGTETVEADLSLIHISEPTRRTPITYAVFCLKTKKDRR